MKTTRLSPLSGRVLGAVCLAILGSGAAASLSAQDPRPPERPGPTLRGWLGVELSWVESERLEDPALLIRRVVRGGPAAEAGLEPGDRVVRFDGGTPTPSRVQGRIARLSPGDRLILEVQRGDEKPRRVAVQAAERPAFVFAGPQGEWFQLHADSLRHVLRMNLDSIRLEIERVSLERAALEPLLRMQEVQEIQMRALEALEDAAIRLPGDTFGAVVRFDTVQRAPFRFHWEHRFSGETVPRFQFQVRPDTVPSGERTRPGRPSTPGRTGEPAAAFPVWTGDRAVAGAELTPMNPELGAYFGTNRGILAVAVVDGTPADRAGLRPGDVIVAVAGEEVETIARLRAALARGYRDPPVPVTVIREGREVELSFPR